MKKQLCSVLLALCMALGLVTVSFAADKTVSSWSELAAAVKAAANQTANITLSCDITAAEGDGEFTIPRLTTVKLDLNGHVLDGAGRTRVFLVEDGGRLTITDSDAQRRGAVAGGSAEDASVAHNGGGVYVAEGGQLELNGATIRDCFGSRGGGAVCTLGNFYMYNGAVIKDCTTWHAGGGGAVHTAGSKAQVVMRDTSVIENCSYCGVWVEKGTFSMEGGTIRNCQARTGGGGVYISEEGTFTLSGGLITGNYPGTNKGAIYLEGTLNLRGGEISDNIVDDLSDYLIDFVPYDAIFSKPSGVINCGGGIVKGGVHLQDNAQVNDDSFYGTTVFFDDVTGDRALIRSGTYMQRCWGQMLASDYRLYFHSGDPDKLYDYLAGEVVVGSSRPVKPSWLEGEWVTADGEVFDFSQPLTKTTILYPKAETSLQADAGYQVDEDTDGGDTMAAGSLFSKTATGATGVTVLLALSLAGNVALLAALVQLKKKLPAQ